MIPITTRYPAAANGRHERLQQLGGVGGGKGLKMVVGLQLSTVTYLRVAYCACTAASVASCTTHVLRQCPLTFCH